MPRTSIHRINPLCGSLYEDIAGRFSRECPGDTGETLCLPGFRRDTDIAKERQSVTWTSER
jgi:hypothetical protein